MTGEREMDAERTTQASAGEAEPGRRQDVDAGGGAEPRLELQLAETQDRLLRTQAELDNVLKRSRRELEEARTYREIDLLRDLLPVLDNVLRAVEAAEGRADAASLLAGFRMTAQQIEKLLAAHGCHPIEAEGHPFDPAVHEAISQQSIPGTPPGHVVAAVSRGYRLHDRVVRPAQVIVSKES
jgi:molecular chaperone GrpE